MAIHFAQLVIGPAGAGKSSYVGRAAAHYAAVGRLVRCVNLDPAAEFLPYVPAVDVRDAIRSRDVMLQCGLGPNGALSRCLESVVSVESGWLDDALGGEGPAYLLIDLPGQIEVCSHMPALCDILFLLESKGYRTLVVFCLDAQCVGDASKFLSGSVSALASMTMASVPRLNVLTKCDLLSESARAQLDWFTEMGTSALCARGRLDELTSGLCMLLERCRIVQWQPLTRLTMGALGA